MTMKEENVIHVKKLCEICAAPQDRAGRLCNRCMGNEPEEPVVMVATTSQVILPSNECKLKPDDDVKQTCLKCGGPFEPYLNGKNWVMKPDQCKTCLMKKKYGSDWNGPTTSNDRKRRAKAKRELLDSATIAAKAARDIDSKEWERAFATDRARNNDSVSSDAIRPVVLRFDGPDEAMYRRLQAIATRERRTLEQQVMFYLDAVLVDADKWGE